MNRTDLLTEINSRLPDNTAGLITPFDVRSTVVDTINNVLMLEDLLAGPTTFLTNEPLTISDYTDAVFGNVALVQVNQPANAGANAIMLMADYGVVISNVSGGGPAQLFLVDQDSGQSGNLYFDPSVGLSGTIIFASDVKYTSHVAYSQPIQDSYAVNSLNVTARNLYNGTGAQVLNWSGSTILCPLRTPTSSTATGSAGQICWDANYIYVCTATNTWKRAVLTSW